MLQAVEPPALRIADDEDHADPAALGHVRALAANLRGLRVVHINATGDGRRGR